MTQLLYNVPPLFRLFAPGRAFDFLLESCQVSVEFIQNNIFTIVIALVSGLMLFWPGLLQTGRLLSAQQTTRRINHDNAEIIDVREAHEFAGGHLPGARNIPLKELAGRVAELAALKEKPLILVCSSGVRSGRASALLKKQGFTDLACLDGGVPAWERAGLPMAREQKA
ncbi:MAG: rhodanese-like domain-containing protein [Zoogloeaceae bacterium]|jgi:rhodanese-related sulfurtransferase|nr:rhodanese-like domain-containing protein [Zoogloeaceae bacterium]